MALSFGMWAGYPVGAGHNDTKCVEASRLSIGCHRIVTGQISQGADNAKVTKRYSIQRAPSGVWSIIDMLTGQPAILDGVLLVGLKLLGADDILYTLNNLDLSDSKAKAIS